MSPVTVVPTYAGIIVSDLARSLGWYSEHLPTTIVDGPSDGWAKLTFADGSEIELVEGDLARPGLSFPSYGRDSGPPVLPGYGCLEPDVLAEGLPVARQLPDWIVVIAPDGLRVVLTGRDSLGEDGIAGFRYTSPDVQRQQAFLERIGATDSVVAGQDVAVVLVVTAGRDATLSDPDGTTLVLVSTRAGV